MRLSYGRLLWDKGLIYVATSGTWESADMILIWFNQLINQSMNQLMNSFIPTHVLLKQTCCAWIWMHHWVIKTVNQSINQLINWLVVLSEHMLKQMCCAGIWMHHWVQNQSINQSINSLTEHLLNRCAVPKFGCTAEYKIIMSSRQILMRNTPMFSLYGPTDHRYQHAYLDSPVLSGMILAGLNDICFNIYIHLDTNYCV